MAERPRRSNRPRAADFTTPLTIPGGAVGGADVVRELAPEVALPVWQTLRSVLMWAGEEPALRGDLFEPCAMEDWEAELLQDSWEPDVRCPLAVLVGELAKPVDASAETIARACLCVTDWALERGHTATALAFAEAAALAWPQQPRYSWITGRLLRAEGRLREAEQWFKRSERAAVASQDYEGRTMALQSLGNLLQAQGNYRAAGKKQLDALRLTKRHRLADREGEILHDLLVVSHALRDLAQAEAYGRAALEAYRPGHPRLPTLAHDVAWIWIDRGYFARALSVLRVLPPLFAAPHERVMALGSAARAAGACGDQDLFTSYHDEVWEHVHASPSGQGVASALFEVANGALDLGDWDKAANALRHAENVARARGEQDVVSKAEQTLGDIARRKESELPQRPWTRGDDSLARAFVRSLQSLEGVNAA
jgi:tetratricopeptide (TPR) repeat protein